MATKIKNSNYFKRAEVLHHDNTNKVIYLKQGVTGQRVPKDQSPMGPVVSRIAADAVAAWRY